MIASVCHIIFKEGLTGRGNGVVKDSKTTLWCVPVLLQQVLKFISFYNGIG
jgi:hypothetical protein